MSTTAAADSAAATAAATTTTTTSTDPLCAFDNRVERRSLRLVIEHDAQTLMRVLELFALRGGLPLHLRFDAGAGPGGAGRLLVRGRLGRHDWDVLRERAATLVGVLDLRQRVLPGGRASAPGPHGAGA